MSVFSDISSLGVSALDVQSMMREAVRLIREKLQYLWVGLLLKDHKTQTLSVLAQAGLKEERFKGVKFEVGKDTGITGEVALTGKYKCVNDLDEYVGPYVSFIDGAMSELAIPLKKRGRVIGVLDIESDKKNAFTSEDISFLRTLTNQLTDAIERFNLLAKLQDELNIRTALSQVSELISSILDLDRLLRTVLNVLRDYFSYWSVSIFLKTKGGEEIELKAFVGYGEEKRPPEVKLKVGKEGITGIVAATGKPLNIGDVSSFPLYVGNTEYVNSELAIPIKKGKNIMGVLDVQSPELNAFTDEDTKILELFSSQLAIAIDNAKLYERMKNLALTDGLTGLYNYRYLMEMGRREKVRSERYNHKFAVLMIDIDDFKKYNDYWGHPSGDVLLKEFTELLRSTLRKGLDFIARYGGEEFTVILPECDEAYARQIAERIRKKTENLDIEGKEAFPSNKFTISVGISIFGVHGKSFQKLLRLADKALYKAKQTGKNKVVVYGE